MSKDTNLGVRIMATCREFLQMHIVLQETKTTKGLEYAIAVVKNSKAIQDRLQSIDDLSAPSPEFVELSAKAKPFIEAQDSEGLKALEDEHKEVLEARKAQLAAVELEMDKEDTLYLVPIQVKHLPRDISAEQLEKIQKIVV